MKIVLEIKSLDTDEVIESVFDRLPILIGRSKICDLVLSDELASRQHSVLELDEKSNLRVVDLQSANGTKINGKKIEKERVAAGDSFRIGDTEVTIEKIIRSKEESTVHDLTPIDERPLPPETTGTVMVSQTLPYESTQEVKEILPKQEAQEKPELPSEPPERPAESDSSPSEQASLKTPGVFMESPQKLIGQMKNWVQVSLFWKDELIDIKCFDRGRIVKIGKHIQNDFVLNAADVPDSIDFLKILAQGIEINLQLPMSGLVETRKGTQDLADLRKTARQGELGLSSFVAFQDRCLIEIGPFSIFIRAVKLRIAQPLEAPLVKEPFYSGVLAGVASFFVIFLLLISGLAEARKDVEEEIQGIVKLEPPPVPQPRVQKPQPKRVTPPKPTPKRTAKRGKVASQKKVVRGGGGAGAKAKGAEGKRGRVDGKKRRGGRPVGFETKRTPPKKTIPKGAVGKEKTRATAKRGQTPDRGTGIAKARKRAGQQAPTTKPKPKVRVEDQGILGVLGGAGGGGSAKQGGRLEGAGLGGELEGALAGLSRGSDSDARGSGGRGARGKEFGGGGSSLEVGGLGTKGKGGGRSGFGLGSSGKKGEAEVSYVVEEVEVRDGLTREEIERVVRAHQNEIRACYEKALIRGGNMNLSGRLKISWFVNRQGRAVSLKKLSGFGAQAGLYDCVSRRISSWNFPRPRGGLGAQVSWPFVFRKGG